MSELDIRYKYKMINILAIEFLAQKKTIFNPK